MFDEVDIYIYIYGGNGVINANLGFLGIKCMDRGFTENC